MSFDLFIDSLRQIEHDQTLFESEIGNELNGSHHEEIVYLGANMIEKLRDYEISHNIVSHQPVDELPSKIVDAIQDYTALLMPEKVCGGYCPCLKPAREGPEYMKKYLTARAKVVSVTFLCTSVIIEAKGEKLNMDSMHFQSHATKIHTLFNTLSAISTKGDDAAREVARGELLAALKQVNKFIKDAFEEENSIDFKNGVRRKIGSTHDLLSPRPPVEGSTMPISRRILVTAQAGLQEVMNSAAMLVQNKSTEALENLDILVKGLKAIRDAQQSEFQKLEDPVAAYDVTDILYRLRTDSETSHTDADHKLRDATKRWNTIKGQSSPRPVVEYQEEIEFRLPPMIPTGVLSQPVKPTKPGVGPEPKKDVFNVLGKHFNNFSQGIEKTTNQIAQGMEKTTSHLFGQEDSASRPAPQSRTPKTGDPPGGRAIRGFGTGDSLAAV